ncbi:interleukin-1 receptor type 2 [Grus japonensis]|uniref:Interleukin-1 receptor type 2 n=1 Tax=Grus japonensis TaxID=30415 RepID=A0ABC9W0P6_GRUJA
MKWGEGKGWSVVRKGREGRAEVAEVSPQGMGHKSPEKKVMLVLLLIEQLAVGWLYSVNAVKVFAAVDKTTSSTQSRRSPDRGYNSMPMPWKPLPISRNSSYCAEVSIHLTVVEKTAAREIAYLQVLFTFTSGKIVCPDLWDFTPNRTSLELKWYKDALPLEDNGEKFVILKGSASLIVTSVVPTDAGYYTCKMSFPYEGVMYEITRTIQLETVGLEIGMFLWHSAGFNNRMLPWERRGVEQEKEKRITPIIVYPTQKTSSAALGSKMTLPCKVFVGLSSHVHTDVEWLANDTSVDVVYKQSRVTEGERQEIVENGENFIEVPLIFDSVEEVDFYTDFTCLAQNRYGYQVLPTRVKQEAVGLSWYIAMIPVALACVIVGGICTHKCWKRRADKGYAIAKV